MAAARQAKNLFRALKKAQSTSRLDPHGVDKGRREKQSAGEATEVPKRRSGRGVG